MKWNELDLEISLSPSQAEGVQGMIERFLEAIDDCLKVIRPSKEEKLGLICMDFQGV